ncbi:MAG: hypothetical protein WC441_01990 [Patescibacteria group bacterium]
MEQKKYRIGNTGMELEISEDYLGWKPESGNWDDLFLRFVKNTNITIINPGNNERKDLFLHHFIIKDALPLEFLLEKRAEYMNVFAIVSNDEVTKKFIIPLY